MVLVGTLRYIFENFSLIITSIKVQIESLSIKNFWFVHLIWFAFEDTGFRRSFYNVRHASKSKILSTLGLVSIFLSHRRQSIVSSSRIELSSNDTIPYQIRSLTPHPFLLYYVDSLSISRRCERNHTSRVKAMTTVAAIEASG